GLRSVARCWGRGRLDVAGAVTAGVGLVVERAVLAGVGQVVAAGVLVLHGFVGVVGAEILPRRPLGAVVAGVVGVPVVAGVNDVLLAFIGVGARLVRHLRRRCGLVCRPARPRRAVE